MRTLIIGGIANLLLFFTSLGLGYTAINCQDKDVQRAVGTVAALCGIVTIFVFVANMEYSSKLDNKNK